MSFLTTKRNNNFMEDFFDFLPDKSNSKNIMKTDIHEKDGNYVFDIDLPGVKKEDIKVSYEDEYITIRIEKKNENEDVKENYIHRERYFGTFEREFYVGNVEVTNIKVSLKDGILNIIVPKEKEEKEIKKYLTIE